MSIFIFLPAMYLSIYVYMAVYPFLLFSRGSASSVVLLYLCVAEDFRLSFYHLPLFLLSVRTHVGTLSRCICVDASAESRAL